MTETIQVNLCIRGDLRKHEPSERCGCKPKKVYDHETARHLLIHRNRIDPDLVFVMAEPEERDE